MVRREGGREGVGKHVFCHQIVIGKVEITTDALEKTQLNEFP